MIIKGKWKEQFTIVPNAIFDAGMTAESVGVLCYLIGRPVNWKVSAVALSNKFKCGKGRMNRVMHELEQHLYAIRRVGGAGGGFDWIITDDPKSTGNGTEPAENTTTAKRDNRKTRQPQNRALQSKEGLQSTEEEETMPSSGELDDSQPPKTHKGSSDAHKEAAELLEYLNTKAGRSYRAKDNSGKWSPHVEQAKARIAEYGVEAIKSVIDHKVSEWGSDEKMGRYLRPDTLFNRTKLANYIGDAESKPSSTRSCVPYH